LVIAPEQGGTGFQYGNMDGDEIASNLRVAFEITKAAKGAANSGSISLYNISQERRTGLIRNSQVTLKAGYQGMVRTLMVGRVLTATSKRAGADIVTTLELLDALVGNTYATIDHSFPAKTKLYEILQAIAEAMHLQDKTVVSGVVMGIPDVEFGRGYVAHGACRDVLEDLLLPIGLEASIQNGQLNILPRGSHVKREAIVLSAETGLLGIPSVALTSVDFEALLDPLLEPGQLVKLETANKKTSGFFKIRSCVMSGDTHDTKWSAACKGVQSPEVITAGVGEGFKFGKAVVQGALK
jgi:hypothetical protein